MVLKLTSLTDKRKRTVWKRAFRIWQRRPHKLAPISEEQKTCASCGTVFKGNYCPRCGQSARIGRFSFKTAFLLFLDVWGIGNRGMFRSIRDLMLRPGYMIRDYLRGQQSAYFPPFKMFFLTTTFSLLISNPPFSDMVEEVQKERTETVAKERTQKRDNGDITINGKQIDKEITKHTLNLAKFLKVFPKKYPALFVFILLVIFSGPLYLFFRHSPAIPDLRYSEHLVAIIYTINASNLYTILSDLTSLVPFVTDFFDIMSIVIVFIALQQFTGLKKRRLLRSIVLSGLILVILLILVIGIYTGILYCIYGR